MSIKIKDIAYLCMLDYKRQIANKILEKIKKNEDLLSSDKEFLDDILSAYIEVSSQEIERLESK